MTKTSTKPKGATTYKETAFGIIPRQDLLKLELEGTKKGLAFVGKNYTKEITPEVITKIHHEAFGWIFPAWAGKYRLIRVEFSGKEPVQPHQIPELVLNLCADLKERLNNLDKSDELFIENVVGLLAWFQHRFVWIHPFQDYNGRVARMLTIFILLKLGLPPIEIKAEGDLDRQKYLEAMYVTDEGNYEKLEKLIESALNESFVKIS